MECLILGVLVAIIMIVCLSRFLNSKTTDAEAVVRPSRTPDCELIDCSPLEGPEFVSKMRELGYDIRGEDNPMRSGFGITVALAREINELKAGK